MADIQLAHDVAEIVFHRSLADRELDADLPIGFARGQEARYLFFSIRKLERRGAPAAALRQIFEDQRRDAAVDRRLAATYRPNHLEQVPGVDILEQIALRPALERL